MQNEALYPFGYGLSYTHFEYAEILLSKSVIHAGESIQCSVIVKNNGPFDSLETVQLYLKDVEASVEVPKWQLQGIRKVSLKAGETIKVQFMITPRQMAMINGEGKYILEPGVFQVYLGGSQPDSRSERLTGSKVLKEVFEVVGDKMELEY